MPRPATANKTTVHTSRTLMFAELAKVMDYAGQNDRYLESLQENVTNKRTKTNQGKTLQYLTRLYGFDLREPAFRCFKYCWQQAPEPDKPLLALLYALGRDYLLAESMALVLSVPPGEKVSVEKLMENVEAQHPNRFSATTRRSIAQNMASSWKQAGYIIGKIKNLRTPVQPGYLVVTLALLLSYLHGDRGNFILASIWTKALEISEAQIRALAYEAVKRDLMQYQFAGNVTTFSFQNLFNKLGIHGL